MVTHNLMAMELDVTMKTEQMKFKAACPYTTSDKITLRVPIAEYLLKPK